MFSMASLLADSIKPQVFSTATSAPSGSPVTVWPASRHRAIICSVFTRFLAQPRETKATLYGIIIAPMFLFFRKGFRRLRTAGYFAHGGKVTKTPPGTQPMDYGSASLRLGP